MAEQKRGRADDGEPSESESLEMDGTKLMGLVIDAIDEQLFNEGLVFKSNADWEAFGEELRDLLFRYYDDEGDDEDYDPNVPAASSESIEESGSSAEK